MAVNNGDPQKPGSNSGKPRDAKPPDPAADLSPVQKSALKVYKWLRNSPVLIIPLVVCIFLYQDTMSISENAVHTLLLAVLHFVVIVRYLRSPYVFVRHHAQQASILLGLRLFVHFLILESIQDEFVVSNLFLFNVCLWFFGSHWGMKQVKQGQCFVAQLKGVESDLSPSDEPKTAPVPSNPAAPDQSSSVRPFEKWVADLSSKSTTARYQALKKLEHASQSSEELVAILKTLIAKDPNLSIRNQAKKTLAAHVRQLSSTQKQSPPKQVQAPAARAAARPPQPPDDPAEAYKRGLELHAQGLQEAAVNHLVKAFQKGNRALKAKALEQLEAMNEVELF